MVRYELRTNVNIHPEINDNESFHPDLPNEYIAMILGKIWGVLLVKSGISEGRIEYIPITEDDLTWFPAFNVVSVDWIDDHIEVLRATNEWLSQHCHKDDDGDWHLN